VPARALAENSGEGQRGQPTPPFDSSGLGQVECVVGVDTTYSCCEVARSRTSP
jgi:hypothetical protein